MEPRPPTLDYGTAPTSPTSMKAARAAIVLVGIALPYLARLPGAMTHGRYWLTDYFGDSIVAVVLVQGFNMFVWVPLHEAARRLRSLAAVTTAAAIGFALPLYLHATLDLRSDAQAAIGLIAIPIYSIPGVVVGCWLGWNVDRAAKPRG